MSARHYACPVCGMDRRTYRNALFQEVMCYHRRYSREKQVMIPCTGSDMPVLEIPGKAPFSEALTSDDPPTWPPVA
jgi:hypothetical protein